MNPDTCIHGIRNLETNLPYCRQCDNRPPKPNHRLLLWNLTVKLRRMLRHGEPDFLKELNEASRALGLEQIEPEQPVSKP